jgi:ABC-2 type transport system permease protein
MGASTAQPTPTRRFDWSTTLLGRDTVLLLRLQTRLVTNSVGTLFRQSVVRPLTVFCVMFVIFGFVFLVSVEGFSFIKLHHLALTDRIVGLVLDLLFLSLGVMLIFSTALLLYASLFASPETSFLLSRPVAADKVFAYKFHGAVAFSSWAFLLLGAPVLVAYGLVGEAPWHFYLFVSLFFVGFTLLPGSFGALLCLLVVNFIPRQRKVLLLVAAFVAVIIAAAVVQQIYWVARHEPLERESNSRLLNRINFARSVHMPSHWVASGLRSSARNGPGDIGQALYYLALVWSNGLLAYLLTTWSSKFLYRRGVNRVVTGGTLRRRYGASRLDRLLAPALGFIDARTRLLLVKDFRTFRRDPAQWSQVLIFSGLLLLAFANIGLFSGDDTPWPYINCISAANVLLIGLLVAVYNGRFIFPLLSLEGRKFWILGLLPIDRAQLLWGKFIFSTTMTLAFAEVLTLFSDLMLRVPGTIVVLHAVTVLLLAVGLSGLSVGLGAALADFRETNPSKIASGFGGTLNSIIGLLYLLAIFAFGSGPWHLAMMFDLGTEFTPAGFATVGVGVGAGVVIALIALTWPLRLGIRSIRRREF